MPENHLAHDLHRCPQATGKGRTMPPQIVEIEIDAGRPPGGFDLQPRSRVGGRGQPVAWLEHLTSNEFLQPLSYLARDEGRLGGRDQAPSAGQARALERDPAKPACQGSDPGRGRAAPALHPLIQPCRSPGGNGNAAGKRSDSWNRSLPATPSPRPPPRGPLRFWPPPGSSAISG